MTRSIFDWRAPEGVEIPTTFGNAYRLQNGTAHRDPIYQARCRCGATSNPRQTRADALEELDGHRHKRARR